MTEITEFRRQVLQRVVPDTDTNAGLWLDRYLQSDSDEAKKSLIKDIAQTIKMPKEYDGFFDHWKRLLNGQGVVTKKAKTLSRLAVNLGAEAVLENSIALNRTYGMPYIPGSALKGLASHYAMNSLGENWNGESQAYKILFGVQEQAGYVNFFDALLVPENGHGLVPDVVTVHHQDYYQKGNIPPADWDNPIPIPFLSVSGSFLIALLGPPNWVDAAYKILSYALKDEGVGAKTSSGYGRMELEGFEVSDNEEKKSPRVEDVPIAPPRGVAWKKGKISTDGKSLYPNDASTKKLYFHREHVLPKGYTPPRKQEVEYVEETLPDGSLRIWVKKMYYPVE